MKYSHFSISLRWLLILVPVIAFVIGVVVNAILLQHKVRMACADAYSDGIELGVFGNSGCSVDYDPGTMSDFPCICRARMSKAQLDRSGMELLQILRGVWHVELNGEGILPVDIERVAELPNVRSIWVRGSGLSLPEMAILEQRLESDQVKCRITFRDTN